LENHILIVDDEPEVCSILAKRLEKEGYLCVTAHGGREALSYFYKNNFSLIISDIRMPETTGMDLLAKIKASIPSMMVIIMTAYPEITLAVEARRLGANDFILKPIDLDLLALTVKKAMEKKRLEEQIEAYHKNLEKIVEERTARLQHAYRVLKKAHLDSVKVLAEAIEAKDPYTRGHSDRVRRMGLQIGRRLGFSEDRLESLEYGALLHDTGKIGIKDEVLQKLGSLTFEEYRHIQDHPLIGVKIVGGIDFFKDKIPVIRHHHEHFDGSGYPDGLVGEAIPLEARIIAVSDAFDAMMSSRPHRQPIPLRDVLMEFEKGKGKQFDPNILEIFLNEKTYKPLIQLYPTVDENIGNRNRYGDGNILDIAKFPEEE
jgi:putative two-component system response regulator